MALIPARADGSRPQVALLGLASLPIVGLLIFTIGMAVGTRPAHVPILALALVSGLLVLVPLMVSLIVRFLPAHVAEPAHVRETTTSYRRM